MSSQKDRYENRNLSLQVYPLGVQQLLGIMRPQRDQKHRAQRHRQWRRRPSLSIKPTGPQLKYGHRAPQAFNQAPTLALLVSPWRSCLLSAIPAIHGGKSGIKTTAHSTPDRKGRLSDRGSVLWGASVFMIPLRRLAGIIAANFAKLM